MDKQQDDVLRIHANTEIDKVIAAHRTRIAELGLEDAEQALVLNIVRTSDDETVLEALIGSYVLMATRLAEATAWDASLDDLEKRIRRVVMRQCHPSRAGFVLRWTWVNELVAKLIDELTSTERFPWNHSPGMPPSERLGTDDIDDELLK